MLRIHTERASPCAYPFFALAWPARLLEGLAAAPVSVAASAAEVPPGFTSNMANVNGVRLHFVSGGAGPALILIHGFPQDWTEYRAIMPRLAKRFTVMALDLRGVGRSSIASGGYDADTLAKDVYEYAAYDLSGRIGAALAIYRAFPANARVNAAAKEPNDTPITIVMGDKSPFAHLIPTMAAGVHAVGFSHVDTDTVANSVHYLVEDNPDGVAALIERHAGK